VDVKRMAAELGVRYVVEGSVRRAGDHIRISAQLIDAATGTNVWNKIYDREIGDLFALQDEISSAIAGSLMGDLTHAEGERAQQRGTQNLDAWSLFQLGLQRDDRKTPEDWAAAGALFKKAVAQDPRFSSAQAMLAVHLLYEANVGSNIDPQKHASDVTTALGIARHAVELDPRDAIAHYALGSVYISAHNLQDGLDSIKRAVDLNPNAAFAWQVYGDAKINAGDPEAALAACQEAVRLDPQ
jgi:tetratricopeptide (TPR) repeat protein